MFASLNHFLLKTAIERFDFNLTVSRTGQKFTLGLGIERHPGVSNERLNFAIVGLWDANHRTGTEYAIYLEKSAFRLFGAQECGTQPVKVNHTFKDLEFAHDYSLIFSAKYDGHPLMKWQVWHTVFK